VKNTFKRDKTLVENACFSHWVGMSPPRRTDYSPFGVILPERTASTAFYRLGFQGQEHDDEVKGDGNSVNFKYRMHDPRVGRFFAVDLLSKEFPWNSSYVFSENRLLDARELEGLEAFFIHGTSESERMWLKPTVFSNARELKKLTNSKSIDTGFSWEDKSILFGSPGTAYKAHGSDDRTIAAQNLANYVFKNKIEDEEITLIGHSHGGNVSVQAAKILFEKYKIKVNVITVNTPAYNSGIEDPANNPGINDMISFYDDKDNIAGGVSKLSDCIIGPYSTDYYDADAKKKTTNVETSSKTSDDYNAHNSIYYDKDVIKRTVKDKKVKKLSKVE
jgi:RHS repeat-associated protein